jgi:hypothetical protein
MAPFAEAYQKANFLLTRRKPMSKTAVAILIGAAFLFAAPAFAVDGVVLINQATVMAAGGFPYKITQPGSYKLSGNLVVPAAQGNDAIDVLASDVTIDLNGFKIIGPETCRGFGSSINCSSFFGQLGIYSTSNDITVRNGSVGGFLEGIRLSGSNNLVEGVHASGNASTGIHVLNGVVRRNTTGLNGGDGIFATNSTVIENTSNGNGSFGLQNGGNVVYGSNAFISNGSSGVFNNGSNVSQNNNICDGAVC